jgi:DNA-binding SARP family transcriptional activator/pimeloyl-ACP methyl ester carboxylesterase
VLVRFLGAVDVAVGGTPREVRGLRRKAVLAALALRAGEIVSAEWLIDVVWGENPPRTAANTLQSHVSYLRRVLGDPAAIVARAPGYVLEAGTDLLAAQRLIEQGKRAADPAASVSHLRAALACWRDRPLVDVTGVPWLAEQAERITAIQLAAVDALTEVRLALGEHAQLVPELERRSRQHPYHEHLHGQLMLALYRSGRQADALATYQRLRHTLGTELGIDPGPALRDFEAAILRQDPALDAPRTVFPPVSAGDESAEPTPTAQEPDTGASALVRFAETPAGRVAYSVTGSGPPLLYLPGWVSHLGLMWENRDHRRFVDALAREHTVIQYDKLGCGLSDRARTDFTMEFELAVVKALVAHLGLERFALFGSCEGGQVAAAYAATHPDTVSSLIVHGSCARGRDLAPDDVRQSLLALLRAHWGLGSRTLADIWLPDASAELTGPFARLQRDAATAEMAASLLEMFYRFDVAELLPAIRVPTLVAHRRGCRAVRFELGRELAALIPGARFAALAGRLAPIYAQGADSTASLLLSFLREHTGPT